MFAGTRSLRGIDLLSEFFWTLKLIEVNLMLRFSVSEK